MGLGVRMSARRAIEHMVDLMPNSTAKTCKKYRRRIRKLSAAVTANYRQKLLSERHDRIVAKHEKELARYIKVAIKRREKILEAA